MKRAFTLVETVILIASISLVSLIGAGAHRWMWSHAELWGYRLTMQDVASSVRQMRYRALHAKRTVALRIDAATRRLQFVTVDAPPVEQESVVRTIWLPPGLAIMQAPVLLTASPSGAMPRTSIVIEAPAFQREFQLRTSPSGTVHLHEEPST